MSVQKQLLFGSDYSPVMRSKPEIRDMENGDVVVDFGPKWFRCTTAGDVICTETYHPRGAEFGTVRSRPATSKERLLALGHAALSE